MKIGIISDIHDNIWSLRKAMGHLQNTHALICCGDLCSPFILSEMARLYSRDIHIVFGNNDGDQYRMTSIAARHPQVTLYGEYMITELGGLRCAANHYPDLAHAMVKSGDFDLVCYGHNHQFAIEQIQSAQLLNPGNLMGYDPARGQDTMASFIIFDTESREALGYEVEESTLSTIV